MTATQRCTHVMTVLVMTVLFGIQIAAAADIRNVTPQQAQSILASKPDIKILDIRTPGEFRAGHIKGALNINFYSKSFREKLAKLDRNAPYLMHCKRGGRSGASLKAFRALGFTNVIHMPAGMDGWKRAKLQTVRQ